MAVRTAPASYFRLVERFPLVSIRDDAHLARAQAMLDGSRSLTKDQVVALARYFGVRPAAFLP